MAGMGRATTQRRYRERLAAVAAPEADDLERALAAALRGYSRSMERYARTEQDAKFLRGMLVSTLDNLVQRGFDRDEAKRRLLRWLRRPPEGCLPITPSN